MTTREDDRLPRGTSTVVSRAWQLAVVVLASMVVSTLSAFTLLLIRAEVATILASAGASFATSIGIGLAIMHFMSPPR